MSLFLERRIHQDCQHPNEIVEPVPPGAQTCKPFHVRKWNKMNVFNRKNVTRERERGSGYPGPEEAKMIMKDIEKWRSIVTASRKHKESEWWETEGKKTKEMLDGWLSMASKMGRVDCHIDPWIHKLWYEYRQKLIDKRAQQREDVAKKTMFLREFLEGARPSYAIEDVEGGTHPWSHKASYMYEKASWPCAPWWREYIRCVGGRRPLRRAPPYPPQSSQQMLEKVEEKALHQFDMDLRFKIGRVSPDDLDWLVTCGRERRAFTPDDSPPQCCRNCQEMLEAVEDRGKKRFYDDFKARIGRVYDCKPSVTPVGSRCFSRCTGDAARPQEPPPVNDAEPSE